MWPKDFDTNKWCKQDTSQIQCQCQALSHSGWCHQTSQVTQRTHHSKSVINSSFVKSHMSHLVHSRIWFSWPDLYNNNNTACVRCQYLHTIKHLYYECVIINHQGSQLNQMHTCVMIIVYTNFCTNKTTVINSGLLVGQISKLLFQHAKAFGFFISPQCLYLPLYCQYCTRHNCIMQGTVQTNLQ